MLGELFSPVWWQQSLLLLPLLLMSFAYHEYAHALVAYRLGDSSQKEKGRLTTNPFKHINLLGFLAFFLTGFGWAKAVRTDNSAFKNPKRDLALVALSGPFANLLLAVFFNILLFLFRLFVSEAALNASMFLAITEVFLFYGIYFNIVQVALNLLPIPPLDGSRVLYSILPSSLLNSVYLLERIGPYILIFLVFSGVIGRILNPIIDFLITGLFLIYRVFQ